MGWSSVRSGTAKCDSSWVDSKMGTVSCTTIAEIIWPNKSLDVPERTLVPWVGKSVFSSGCLGKFSLKSGQKKKLGPDHQEKGKVVEVSGSN